MKSNFKKVMGNQAGFSLMELLVSIVIIGLVTGGLISVFGGPLSSATLNSAASKTVDDMRTISEAAKRYYIEKGTKVTALTDLTTVGFIETLPLPQPNSMLTGFTANKHIYTFGTGTLDGNPYIGWGDAAADDSIIFLPGLSEDVCKKINEKFAGAAATDAAPLAPDSSKDVQCWDNTTSANAVDSHNYTAIKLVYVN